MLKKRPCLVLLLTLLAAAASGATLAPLTVDKIMRGHDLVGWEPQAVRWSPDGMYVYFNWKQAGDPLEKDFDTWMVGRDGKGLCRLSEEEAKNAPPERASWSADRSLAVYDDDGDVYLFDAHAGRRRALTRTTEKESHPRITPDGSRVAFVRGENLFVLTLDDGTLEQVTNMTRGGDPLNAAGWPEKKETASQKWLEEEERKLLDVVARRAKKKEDDEAKEHRERPLRPYKLSKEQSISDLILVDDGRYVVALIDEKPDEAKQTMVPRFISQSGYVEETESRRKVGDLQTVTKLVALNAVTGEAHPLDAPFPEKAAKTVRIDNATLSRDGMRLAFQAESADNKDLWIVALDPATGKGRILDAQHDDAWIGGPATDTLGILSNGRVYFTSEKTGWSHLYTVPWEGGQATALTSGGWEVAGVRLTDNERWLDLTTSAASPFEHRLERISVDGGPRKELTGASGFHEAIASPDGGAIADLFSQTNRPAELYVGGVKVTTSPTPEFFAYPWQDAPIVRFTARDGTRVPARLYKPPHFRRGGPAVIFVHGAGYLQNVTRGWSYYFREYLFHHLLMERGVTVLDVDYRGSAGYGRAWRTAIYRHMGGKDLDDQVDGAKWLVREHGVDPRRVGIYGGSYGGFITLMAMFTQPDAFAAGAALRPVTDWAHYNHPYTSDILNLPQEDAEAYRRSSPIYFAEGLRGALLICHGMFDTNVHFQDSVRLAQRLIELRKENWELAPYPAENHSFVEPTSWADEYKRILKLFERTVMR